MPYLLPCPQCGSKLQVTTGEAGQQVRCDCGAAVDVPTVRGLRELPLVVEEVEPRSRWTTRHSVAFLGIVLLVAGLAIGFVLHGHAESVRPDQSFASKVKDMSPAETWDLWSQYFQYGIGTWQVQEGPTQRKARNRYQSHKNFEHISYGIAGIGVLVAALGWILLKPTPAGRPSRASQRTRPTGQRR
jgi:tetrahydromethanopterin S-methyltransferase subunit F